MTNTDRDELNRHSDFPTAGPQRSWHTPVITTLDLDQAEASTMGNHTDGIGMHLS